eukprot:6614060-Prymnesium_polylepis.1
MVGEGADAAEVWMALAAVGTGDTVVMEEETVAAVKAEPVVTATVLMEDPVRTAAVDWVDHTGNTGPRSLTRRSESFGPIVGKHSSRLRVAHPPMRLQQAETRLCELAAAP